MSATPGDPTTASIWRDGAFLRLWSASAVSFFGSFVTRTALPLAAILVLGAGPLGIATLRGLEVVAGLLVGLVAGAWVDRLPRLPIMVGADLGRAILLGSIPVAAVAGVLGLTQIFVVAFAAAVLTTFFDVADRAYLPSVVRPERLVAANSALTASASVSEFTGFGVSGFLIQLFTAPIAIAVDAVSFIGSAALLATIRRPEPARPPAHAREPIVREIRDGLRIVLGSPVLRAIAGAHGSTHVLWGIVGTSYLLFATRELGLSPAAIGIIAGLGGLGSFVGAAVTGRLSRRLGTGPTIIVGLVGFTLGTALIPLAPSGAVLVGAAFLVGQQVLGDSFATVADILEVSLMQSSVDGRVLGRVTASMDTVVLLLQLGGTIAGGILAEALGLRAAMAIALLGGVTAIVLVWRSPIRSMRGAPVVVADGLAIEVLPITE